MPYNATESNSKADIKKEGIEMNTNINFTNTAKTPDKLTSNYLWSKIKGYCKYNKIDRTELARALQVTPTTVSNYSQSADNLKLSSIYNFCKVYHIDSLCELEQF